MTAIDIIQWLGETSLAVGLLIALVLIVRKPFGRAFGARAAYALWLAPAARLFLPELKILPAPLAAPEPFAWTGAAAPIATTPTLPVETVMATPSFDFVSLAAATTLIIWATVAFAWFNIKIEAQTKFLRAKMATSRPASPAIGDRAQALSKQFGLKRTPRIRISEDETGPCVVGLFWPVIFLPAAFEKDFSERERYLALAHEIAHVARGDMAATLAAIAVQSAQWPNPLVHFAFQKFRTDQEAACDAFVLARCSKGGAAAGEYASAIMKSVRGGGSSAPAYGLSLAHPVKERLMLLKNQKKSPVRLLAGAGAVIAFTAASLGATASYGFEEGKKKPVVLDVSTNSNMVITVDKGETLEIDGVKNPGKIEIENKNGDRTVRIYNKRGKLISENVYGPDDKMPFDEVVIKDKDGETHRINLTEAPRTEKMSIMRLGDADGDHDINWTMEVIGDGEDGNVFFLDGDADVMKEFAFNGDGPRVMAFGGDISAHCLHMEGDDAPVVFEWRTEDKDAEGAEKESATKAFTREIVCLDAEADPEKRAELLRKAIDRMEANAKREAERRQATIARMREELKELEKNN